MVDVPIPEGVQIAAIYAGLATTAIVVIGGPILVPVVSMWVARQNAKTAAMLAQLSAAAAKVEHVADKVETVAVTAGVAANKVTALTNKVDDVQKTLEASAERRDQQLEVVVAKVDTMSATVDATAKTAIETHVLVDGQMGRVLDIGLKAARLLAKAEPTEANLKDLELAETAKREHEAKMKIVEAKNAATPEAKP